MWTYYYFYYEMVCGLNVPGASLPRQDRESAERAHDEDMASVTLSARERERELAALLERTEAQHQQRGQCFCAQRWWHWTDPGQKYCPSSLSPPPPV